MMNMATVPTQIRIDAKVKEQASRLFSDLRNRYVQRRKHIPAAMHSP